MKPKAYLLEEADVKRQLQWGRMNCRMVTISLLGKYTGEVHGTQTGYPQRGKI